MARFSELGVGCGPRWATAVAAVVSAVSLLGASSASATVPVWPAPSELTLPVSVPTSTNAANQGVSCTSAGNCAAVGWYVEGGGYEPMAATETSGTWGQAVALTPAANAAVGSGQWDSMTGVSCTSSGNCVAVGAYEDAGGVGQAMVSSESDGTWGQISEITPPPDESTTVPAADLFAVSCTSSGNCVAVGSYQNSNSEFEPMVVTETDGTWGQARTLPLPADAGTIQGSELKGISCASAGNCTAVGSYANSSGGEEPMVVSETDGSWGDLAPLAPPLSAETGTLYAIACTSAGDCGAVGYDGQSSNASGLMETTETNGIWGQASQLTLPPNSNTAGQVLAFGGISCTQAGNCVMVGQYQDAGGSNEPLVATESNGDWGQARELTLPANATTSSSQYAGMYGISCTSAGECAAGGTYTDGGGTNQAMGVNSISSLSIPGTHLGSTRIGSPYHAQLSAAGATGRYTWSLVSGSLPTGLRLTPQGIISGNPTQAGTRRFTVKVSDPGPPVQHAIEALSINVDPGPLRTVTMRFANQKITLTTPSACVAPNSKLLVTFDSKKRSVGEKLRFSRLAVYIDRGSKREVARRINGIRRLVTVYRPSATSRHEPARLQLQTAGLAAKAHTLRVVVHYVRVHRADDRKSSMTVTKRLYDSFSVC